MNISIIVAASTNNAIGKDNQLLWHLPTDLKFFKNATWAMPLIMGRKTFDSIGKPLPGRHTIVLTTNNNFTVDDVINASSIDDAIEKAKATNCKEAFVVGGGEIYQAMLPLCNTIYLTRVHTVIDGDTFFPEINMNDWELKDNKDFEMDGKHQYPFSIQKWERKINH